MRPFHFMRRLLRVSRPRFWMYVFGPYIVGALCGADTPLEFFSPTALGLALFFLFPANLLIYGVNDIFDYETDVLNAKKRGYEAVVPPDERRELAIAIGLFCLPFLLVVPKLPFYALLALAAFLFFSIYYSAPPIRAKARPFLDSAFNVLYILPGACAYFVTGGEKFAWELFIGAWAWAWAMHAYSAVPDISADKEAQIPTIATFLGLKPTLWLCGGLYALAAICALAVLHWLAVILVTVYLGLIALSIRSGSEDGVMQIYRFFPLINTVAGASIFWFVLWTKPQFWPQF